MALSRTKLESPLGPLELTLEGTILRGLDFAEPGTRPSGGAARLSKEAASRHPVVRSLKAYFAGRLNALDAIEVRPEGTEFLTQVWRQLRAIPPGQTWSYAELAARLGRPLAVRAVGMANAKNPIPLVVPCHRVVAAGGGLGGYSGELWRKEWLLRHEGASLKGQEELFPAQLGRPQPVPVSRRGAARTDRRPLPPRFAS